MELNDLLRNDYSEAQEILDSLPYELEISKAENIKVKHIFPRTGKQGILGTVTAKKEDSKLEFVFKFSQYINFVIREEWQVLNALTKLNWVHNYCRGYGIKRVLVDGDYKKKKNPLKITDKYPIYQDILFMEHLEGCRKLFNYILNKDVENEVIFSQIKQTLCAVSIAQKHSKFTHYDLHSNNVLVKECNPNTLFLYILDPDNVHLIPSYGFYPVIVDFGFSYVKDMENGPLYGALAHTDVGFMSDRFDNMSDPRLFLTTVSHELQKYRRDGVAKKFRKLVRNIFKPIKQDWEAGWDEVDDMPASDYVKTILDDSMDKSTFFIDCGHYCTDIIQGLIKLPLKKRSYKNISDVFDIFYTEFSKIEDEISSNYYLLYIFREMVDAAIEVRELYLNGDTKHAVQLFRHKMYKTFSQITKFCNPKINYEKLLVSLFLLAKNTEGILYEVMRKRDKERSHQKNKMDLNNVEEILGIIDYNFSDSYQISSEHQIVVIDSISQKRYAIELPQECLEEMNAMDESLRGKYIYSLLNPE